LIFVIREEGAVNLRWLIVIPIVSLLISCGINRDLEQAANECEERLQQARSEIESAQKKYTDWIELESNKTFSRFEGRYHWREQYEEAIDELDKIQSLLTDIQQVLKANDPEDEDKLKELIADFNSRLTIILEKTSQPWPQIATLLKYSASTGEVIEQAVSNSDLRGHALQELRGHVDKVVAESKAYGWGKEEAILAKMKELEIFQEAIVSTIKFAGDAYNKERGETNASHPDQNNFVHVDGDDFYVYNCLPVVVETLQKVGPLLDELEQSEKQFRKSLDGLYRSYSKRLIDMKVSYTVVIGKALTDGMLARTVGVGKRSQKYIFSDGDYYYPPREVNKEGFYYLSDQTGKIASGIANIKLYIPADIWNSLELDVSENSWRHNEAVYRVSGTKIKYYHRYLIIEQGNGAGDRVEPGYWEEVSEETFARHIDHLGMDLKAKAFGMHELEMIDTAMPPAIAFVGNKKYGHWQDGDESGRKSGHYWVYDGWYSRLNSLFDGLHYSYEQWDEWRKNYRAREPYYDKNPDGTTLYGTLGSAVENDSYFKTTEFFERGGMDSVPDHIRSWQQVGLMKEPGQPK
jgi:iron-sulfur cluster repair protein YtfE (RIC family)